MSETPTIDTAEQTLLEGLRKGDRASQETLVRQYGPRVLATAKRYLRNPEDAADVFQDVFLTVIKGIGRFEGRSTLWYWMRGITIKMALLRLRQQRKWGAVPLDTISTLWEEKEEPLRPVHSSEQQAECDEVGRHVRNAVDSLPEQHRSIIVLRDFRGASTREAADILGIAESAAKVRLHRARGALRDLLNRRFQRADLLHSSTGANPHGSVAELSPFHI